jgi:hypothetical protein
MFQNGTNWMRILSIFLLTVSILETTEFYLRL